MLHLLRIRSFRRAILLRGFGLWVAIRIAAAFLGNVDLNVATKVLVICIIAVTVGGDAVRRGEHIFLGNLGIPLSAIIGLALPIPVLLEVVLP